MSEPVIIPNLGPCLSVFAISTTRAEETAATRDTLKADFEALVKGFDGVPPIVVGVHFRYQARRIDAGDALLAETPAQVEQAITRLTDQMTTVLDRLFGLPPVTAIRMDALVPPCGWRLDVRDGVASIAVSDPARAHWAARLLRVEVQADPRGPKGEAS